MTTARIQRVLLQADGPLLILLRDAVDGAWVGLAADRSPHGDTFACVPVSSARLAALKFGEMDLRAIFEHPEIDRRASLFVPAEWKPGSSVALEAVEDFHPEWLPDEGFFLSAFGPDVAPEARDIVEEATVRNRPVVHANFNPPEAKAESKIDAFTLAEGLTTFQNVVKRAHALVTRTKGAATRKLLAAAENYTFEVYGFSYGSFEVHMQAKSNPDLFGSAPHVEALAKLDEIASRVHDIEAAVEVAQANRGHFVSAVRALMYFIADRKTPLKYSWTEPNGEVRSNLILPDAASALYTALAARQELSQQVIKLVGVFDKIHVKSGRWTVITQEDGEFSGRVAQGSGVTLKGLTTSSVTYELECRDVLEEGVVNERQTSRLELLKQPVEIKLP